MTKRPPPHEVAAYALAVFVRNRHSVEAQTELGDGYDAEEFRTWYEYALEQAKAKQDEPVDWLVHDIAGHMP